MTGASGDKVFTYLSYLFLVFIAIASIEHSILIREPWFGKVSQWNDLTSITAHTLRHLQNWHEEGAIKLFFASPQKPFSIESQTLLSRELYVSYPPGYLLPLYFLSEALDRAPTYNFIMYYNLLNQFLVALSSGFLAYYFLRTQRVHPFSASLLSTLPIFAITYLKAPLFLFQNAYFADTAVLLPYILFVFLEYIRLRREDNFSKKLSALQFIVCAWGAITDYLFFFLILTTLLTRFMLSKKPREIGFVIHNASLWFPVFAALIVHFAHVYLLDAHHLLFNRLLVRLGLVDDAYYSTLSVAPSYLNSIKTFYIFQFHHFFGLTWSFILIATLATFFIYLLHVYRKHIRLGAELCPDARSSIVLLALITLPSLLQVHVFSQHSAVHGFSTLKFIFLLSIGTFVVLPRMLLASNLIKESSQKYTSSQGALNQPKVLTSIVVVFLIALSANYRSFEKVFPVMDLRDDSEIGRFINENTGYSDIVFSDFYDTPTYPPQKLTYTRKMIYRVQSLAEMRKIIGDIKDEYMVNLFVKENTTSELFRELISIAGEYKTIENYRLYKIKKSDFLKYDDLEQ